MFILIYLCRLSKHILTFMDRKHINKYTSILMCMHAYIINMYAIICTLQLNNVYSHEQENLIIFIYNVGPTYAYVIRCACVVAYIYIFHTYTRKYQSTHIIHMHRLYTIILTHMHAQFAHCTIAHIICVREYTRIQNIRTTHICTIVHACTTD